MINFETSHADFELIVKIAVRAVALARRIGAEYEQRTAVMDLTACHCNGMRLHLQALLSADDGNFGHDVFGIRRHLNRRTGKLMDCFVPRFAA